MKWSQAYSACIYIWLQLWAVDISVEFAYFLHTAKMCIRNIFIKNNCKTRTLCRFVSILNIFHVEKNKNNRNAYIPSV